MDGVVDNREEGVIHILSSGAYRLYAQGAHKQTISEGTDIKGKCCNRPMFEGAVITTVGIYKDIFVKEPAS